MDKKSYLTLDDALKIQGAKSFMAMTKPVGSKCNLNCTYCYYLDKERFYGKTQDTFSDEMLEKYIRDYKYQTKHNYKKEDKQLNSDQRDIIERRVVQIF